MLPGVRLIAYRNQVTGALLPNLLNRREECELSLLVAGRETPSCPQVQGDRITEFLAVS